MKKKSFLTALALATVSPAVLADGTETLGPPSIAIAGGTGMACSGTGLVAGQPGNIVTDVPLGSMVQQVLLYWSGEYTPSGPGDDGDDTVTVDGNVVVGTLIGGPTLFFGSTYVSTFRADITGLGLIAPGVGNVSIDDVDFNLSNNGAGLCIVYEIPGAPADLQLLDGSDLAFINFAPPLDTTVPQTFTFPMDAAPRTAELSIVAASVGAGRPNVIEVNVGANTLFFDNMLASVDGDLWDTLLLDIPIPAGETQVTVQIRSEDRLGTGINPASLTWIGAGLSVPEEPPMDGCTRTLGYWKTHSSVGRPERDPTWDLLPMAEDTPFFDTGISYIEMLWTQPRGSAYVILAHQYIAAILNGLAGADTTSVDAEIMQAMQLLDLYDGNPLSPSDIDKDTRTLMVNLATTLDSYNNGVIGPGHCDPERLELGVGGMTLR